MKTKQRFLATGLVYGLLWGGGEGVYKAKDYYNAETVESLREQITKGVETGSIDSGMGYERILGALMKIATITTIIHDNKEFENIEYEDEFFGDLNESQQEFLIQNI